MYRFGRRFLGLSPTAYRIFGGASAGTVLWSGSVFGFRQNHRSGSTFGTLDGVGWRLEYPEKRVDDVRLSRKVVSPVDESGLNLRLYQYQTCPYCSKVRAFLDYYGFSYEVVEVNPVNRKQIQFSQIHRKVPIVVVQGFDHKQLNESSFVVSLLKTFLTDLDKSLQQLINFYPHHRRQDDKGKESIDCPNKYFVMFEGQLKDQQDIQNKREEREWREWIDSHFVHVISPNIYRTPRESLATFRWFSQVGDWHINFPVWERFVALYVGAAGMFIIAKRLKKRHGIINERESLYAACDKWMAAIGPDRPFLGGNEPNLADLEMYGVLSAFKGCLAFEDMCRKTNIEKWFKRMKVDVESHRGSTELINMLAIRRKNGTVFRMENT